MNLSTAKAIHREEDNELLGYVKQNGDHWDALTLFGYAFGEAAREADARNLVQDRGLGILGERWEYLDAASGQWLECVLVEVAPDRVRVARMDGFYPATSKTYVVTGDVAEKLRRP